MYVSRFAAISIIGLLAVAAQGGEPTTVVRAGPLTAKLGPREVLLPDRAQGLRYFPDMAVACLQSGPRWRLLVSAGIDTRLLEGRDPRSLTVVGNVLTHDPNSRYDNGYAGIGGAVRDTTGDILALYHAEDQVGLRRNQDGVPGFYCTVALARSSDDGRSFRKLGPVLSTAASKRVDGPFDQGCGEPCLLLDAERKHLLCYYVDHAHVGNRGVQICLARAAVESHGAPGSWRKYCDGRFDEPGLGGRDTPVVTAAGQHSHALFPQATWAPSLQHYVMLYNINAHLEMAEHRPADRSGIYLALSADGLRWAEPVQLLKANSICRLDAEVAWHPTLLVEQADADRRTLRGWLLYAYSPRWGDRAPRQAHFLVGHTLELSFDRPANP